MSNRSDSLLRDEREQELYRQFSTTEGKKIRRLSSVAGWTLAVILIVIAWVISARFKGEESYIILFGIGLPGMAASSAIQFIIESHWFRKAWQRTLEQHRLQLSKKELT